MIVTINGNVTDALRSHVLSRLQAALDQFAGSVRNVSVQLHDLNGPRGGSHGNPDQAARVQVQLAGTSPVVIEHRGTDMYAVISVAASRAKQTVSRLLKHRTDKRHGR